MTGYGTRIGAPCSNSYEATRCVIPFIYIIFHEIWNENALWNRLLNAENSNPSCSQGQSHMLNSIIMLVSSSLKSDSPSFTQQIQQIKFTWIFTFVDPSTSVMYSYICKADHQRIILSNFWYKAHPFPKPKCFWSRLALFLPNPLTPDIKSRMKM